jgi:hypothetical protein
MGSTVRDKSEQHEGNILLEDEQPVTRAEGPHHGTLSARFAPRSGLSALA